MAVGKLRQSTRGSSGTSEKRSKVAAPSTKVPVVRFEERASSGEPPAQKKRKGPLAPPPDEEDEIRLESSENSEDDDSDSDSDDGEGADIPGIDISKLPTIAKDDATVARRLSAAKAKQQKDKVFRFVALWNIGAQSNRTGCGARSI